MLLSSNITIPLVAVYHVNSTLRGKFLLKFLKTGNSYTNRHGPLQITKNGRRTGASCRTFRAEPGTPLTKNAVRLRHFHSANARVDSWKP